MKKVVILRNKWDSGALLRYDNGKQCCLGFVCEAYGIPKENLWGHGFPHNLSEEDKKKLPKWLQGDDAIKASLINDGNATWSAKEKQLRPLFRKHRIQLVFRGKR